MRRENRLDDAMAAKASDSSRTEAGLEMITQALPFETIPDEPLRAHFARWLLNSLATADRLGPFPSLEPETPLPADLATAREPSRAAGMPPSLPKARAAALPEPPPDDPPSFEPLALEWQGPPAPPRPQFVRQRDGTVWLTKPILRTRGWTDAAVRDFLPEPEGLKPNPRFAAAGAPMPVWRPATVAAAEATAEWQDWLERSLRRRRTTLEALAETEDEDFRTRLDAARAAIETAIATADERPPAQEGASQQVVEDR
ncbi:hypothetical protein AB0K52_24045 [Glycomyces sp. NPDC049804]|uniref:hypothetical protein n=1 Tax=Glycomyces sp. NPDC049804 TaxID=3154363 RepID=UPI00342C89C2